MRAAEENLGPAVFAAHVQDQRADTVVHAHHFARDLRIAADDALGAAEIDDDMAELDALRAMGLKLFQGYLFAKTGFRHLPDCTWPVQPNICP